MTLGELMKEKRHTLNMTRQDMSNLMNVSVNSVINWESDGHPPNPDKFGVIMNAYQIDRDDFGKAYMDTVCPKEPDFPDDFPTEYFSDAALKLLPQLKFSAEEVELWRMLRLYTDFEWYFSDSCGVTAMQLVEHLPESYIGKTGIGNILNMIYDIQSKLPNRCVEQCLCALFCPTRTPRDFSEYGTAFSEKGFDATTLNSNLLEYSGLVYANWSKWYEEIATFVAGDPDSYIGINYINTSLDRLSGILEYILKDFDNTGYRNVFEKDLHKKYNGYEYINEEWLRVFLYHTDECISNIIPADEYSELELFDGFDKNDATITFYTLDQLEDFEKPENYEEELAREKNYANKVFDTFKKTDFWRYVVENNETEVIIDSTQATNGTWNDVMKTIPSPFPDWIEFHYEKTDDKLICTATLTKKGIQWCVDAYGWEQCINKSTLENIDIPVDRTIPTEVYNNVLNVVSEYINTYNRTANKWSTDLNDSDFSEFVKTASLPLSYYQLEDERTMHTNVNAHREKLQAMQKKAKLDEVTAKDLKDIIELGIWWKKTNDSLDCLRLTAELQFISFYNIPIPTLG